jgi:hypothetical protein
MDFTNNSVTQVVCVRGNILVAQNVGMELEYQPDVNRDTNSSQNENLSMAK